MRYVVPAMLVVVGVIHLMPLSGALGGERLAAGFVSVVSFLYLAWSTGHYNAQLGRVVAADVVALVCLAIGAVAHGYRLRAG